MIPMDLSSDEVIADDTDPAVAYYPIESWNIVQGEGDRPDEDYYGGLYRMTRNRSAYATFSFTGSHVAYYSDMNHDHGAFKVSIDDRTVATSSSYSPEWQRKHQLFNQSVEPGSHVLRITNMEDSVMGADFFAYAERYRDVLVADWSAMQIHAAPILYPRRTISQHCSSE
ncbi:hypothetical protein EXIGLDRAFT_701774 [Exidia glandulosa HHB12029]|uniref:Uncharacterized protein n=1 Tax=Exidia glandulosa HHB12029 TaxID=1314781 RepID=A0A165CW80_EXIGL|nr:hypothetical protein EXIGLDRAFT_701774 [Exidia glandulosa HHB12029]